MFSITTSPPAWQAHADILPSYMREPIIAYIENGRPVGDFLTALLSNDLMKAFERADENNMRAMRSWVIYLYNHAPAGCYGSPARHKAWLEHRGLDGLSREGAKS